jgi:hypothetical protein
MPQESHPDAEGRRTGCGLTILAVLAAVGPLFFLMAKPPKQT